MSEFYKQYKEYIDQPLHFLMVFVPVALCLIHPAFAVVPALMFSLAREYYQHDRVVLWNLDLCFSYAGGIAGVLLLIFL